LRIREYIDKWLMNQIITPAQRALDFFHSPAGDFIEAVELSVRS